MNNENGKAIITLFSELNKFGVEIFLTEQGWIEYEILLESEDNAAEEKAG